MYFGAPTSVWNSYELIFMNRFEGKCSIKLVGEVVVVRLYSTFFNNQNLLLYSNVNTHTKICYTERNFQKDV